MSINESTNKPRWISATLRNFFPFAEATLELTAGKTIITGHNGAGKTALLEGLDSARRAATSASRFGFHADIPNAFTCEGMNGEGRRFVYHYDWRLIEKGDKPSDSSADADADEDSAYERVWSEWCKFENGTVMWEVKDGRIISPQTRSSETLLLPPGAGLMSVSRQEPAGIRNIFRDFVRIRPGIPRERARSFLVVSNKKRAPVPYNSRIHILAAKVVRYHEESPELFAEFVDILQRLKLAKQVTITIFSPVVVGVEDRDSREDKGDVREREIIKGVYFDGVNIGLLSDGTLRVAEIVIELISRPILLVIEEPETALHPGLLNRLLRMLEGYSDECQLLISTHSPQVVSWAQPGELRLVQKHENKDGGSYSTVRSLQRDESKRLASYLTEDGTLGEFLFGGGIEQDDQDNSDGEP